MKKQTRTLRRTVTFTLAALLLLTVPMQTASALFGKGRGAAVSDGISDAPIAQNTEVRVYRNIPYVGALRAASRDGGPLTFRIVEEPGKGSVELGENGGFVYRPAKNKTGSDRFTFTASDEAGNESSPATVRITIERTAANVTYADMDGNPSYTAAVDLAEHGVFLGAQVGGSCFFEPQRIVSRGEFVAMAMAAMGAEVSSVSVTGFCDDDSIPTWAKGYAASALKNGVVYGVSTEEGVAFASESAITLNEAAAVLNRLLTVTDVDLNSYAPSEESWCAQAVANLESVSVIESGRFSAEDMRRGLTRAEAADLLSSAITLMENKQQSKSLLRTIFG